MTDTTQKVEVQYVSTGADRAAADYGKVAAAEKALQQVAQGTAAVHETVTRSTLSVSAAMDRYVRQLDPAARSLAVLERGERLLSSARQQGVSDLSALERAVSAAKEKYDGLTGATERAAQAIAKSRAAQQQIDRATGVSAGPARGSDDIAAYGKMLDDTRAKYVPLYAAGRQYRATLDEIAQAAKVGAISETERAAAVTRTKDAFAGQVTAMKAGAGQAGLQRYELINLSRQIQDVGVSLAGGQNPMTVLIQQGSQIGDVFAASKAKMSDVLASGAAWAGRFAFSLAGVATGALAAGAAVAYVASSYASSQREMERSLFGVGRGSGMTGASMSDAARRAAASSDSRMSVGDARTATMALTATGRVNRDLIGPAAATIGAFAKISGQELPDAAKQVAQALSDPIKGVADLDKSLGFLNDRLAQTVKNLAESGDMAGAQRAAFDAYSASIDANRKALDANRTGWEKLKESISNGTSNAFNAAGKALFGGDLSDQLKAAQDRVAEIQKVERGSWGYDNAGELRKAEAKVAEISGKIAEARAVADRARADVAANDLSMAATATARQYLPESGSLQALVNRRDQIGRLMADPLARSKSSMSSDELAQAYSRASTAVASFETPIQKLIADTKLATDAIGARTFAERSNIAAEQARLASLRSSHDAVLASAEAEAARNKLIAEGNRKAEDMRRAANDNLALVGLDPFQRRMKEIEFKYRDFDREFVPKAGETKPETPVVNGFVRVGASAEQLATTLTAASAKIAATPFGGLRPLDSPAPVVGSIGAGIGGMDAYKAAIKKIESGGNYGQLGPITKTGDRAFGAYQVMGNNIGPWTRQALGYSMTPAQFLASKEAQDAVFTQQFSASIAKFGNPQDAASVWFTGRPLSQGAGARDILGTSGQKYVDMFTANLRGGGVTALPSVDVVAAATPNVSPVASTAARDAAAAKQAEQGAARRETLENPMRDATRGMEEMQRATQLLSQTFGASPAVVAAANEVEKLRTQYINAGIAPGKASADMLKVANDNLAALGQTAITAYQQQQAVKERQEQVQQAFDDMRSMTGEFLSGPLKSIAQGEKPDKAFKQAGAQLGGRLIDMGVKDIVKMLWGKDGSVGQGLFGGLLGKGFGLSQSTTAATADIKAGIVNVNGAVSGLGGSGGGLGGIFGSLFGGGGAAASGSILAGMPVMFAQGGVMTSWGAMPLRKYATGGVANSPQMAIFGEGSHNEAFVPLPDGRSIPVSMRGGQGGGNQMINARGGDVIINGNADTGMIDQVKAYIDQSNARLHATISRNLPTMMQQSARRYG